MNAKLGQHLTLLGLCAMIFYGFMLGTGRMTSEVMPQFIVSALIFLSAGRLFKKTADESDDEPAPGSRREPDWDWLTALLNWSAALLIIGIMAILLMKPVDVSLLEAFSLSTAQQNFFAGAVP